MAGLQLARADAGPASSSPTSSRRASTWSRRGYARRRLPEPVHRLRLGLGHEHGDPARRGLGGAAQAAPPELDAGAGQVGADDDRDRGRLDEHGADDPRRRARPRRRPDRPDEGRARRASRSTGRASAPARSRAGQSEGLHDPGDRRERRGLDVGGLGGRDGRRRRTSTSRRAPRSLDGRARTARRRFAVHVARDGGGGARLVRGQGRARRTAPPARVLHVPGVAPRAADDADARTSCSSTTTARPRTSGFPDYSRRLHETLLDVAGRHATTYLDAWNEGFPSLFDLYGYKAVLIFTGDNDSFDTSGFFAGRPGRARPSGSTAAASCGRPARTSPRRATATPTSTSASLGRSRLYHGYLGAEQFVAGSAYGDGAAPQPTANGKGADEEAEARPQPGRRRRRQPDLDRGHGADAGQRHVRRPATR